MTQSLTHVTDKELGATRISTSGLNLFRGDNDEQVLETRHISDIETGAGVVRTNESPYVDGMGILFRTNEDSIEIDPLYYENTPEYQGGEVGDAVEWLERNGEIAYQQLNNPYHTD